MLVKNNLQEMKVAPTKLTVSRFQAPLQLHLIAYLVFQELISARVDEGDSAIFTLARVRRSRWATAGALATSWLHCQSIRFRLGKGLRDLE
jgi:hypothetical protein